MSYRFLPWVRQGLAGRIADADTLGSTIPARARFPVRVDLTTGDASSVDLRLHGPGDIIGLDPRSIVRTEPPRHTANAAPNSFAAIEFDPPDLPWMFSPAKAGSQDRLRPWLVLVVVAVQDGVAITVRKDRPLPQLSIEPPAVPASELPALSESWAWAHVHAVESAPPSSVPDHLRDKPDQSLSRLMCPRRLEPDRDYLACLVPAFEVGRLAGLGQDVPEEPTTQAAWGASGSVGASVTLPVYFHWQFRTGPAGDFESLSRRLTPRPLPDTVGFRRTYIGDAHPALPHLPPDEGGIVNLEGALRAPDPGEGETLGPEHDDYVAELVGILNAPADHAIEGASPGAESVAPPIYGGAHVKVERLDGTEHKWLGELNRDPRHRAAAGLGTEIVRQNQEQFMHAAWEQVGEVLEANRLLDLARFIQEAMDRIHRRHVAALDERALLGFTAPVHARALEEAGAMAAILDASTLPAGVTDPGFRRLASPRSPVLRRAQRLAGMSGAAAGEATVTLDVVNELATGAHRFDHLAVVPDGITGTRLLDALPRRRRVEVGEEIGAPATVAAEEVVATRELVTELEAEPVPGDITLRPDLAMTGVILDGHVALLEDLGATRDLSRTISEVLGHSGTGGIALNLEEGGHLSVIGAGAGPGGGDDTPVRRGPAARARLGTGGRLTSGPAAPPGVGRARTSGTGVPGTGGLPTPPGRPRIPGTPNFPTTPPRPGEGGPALPTDPEGRPEIPPPVRDPEVVGTYTDAFEAHRAALEVTVTSVIPPPQPLDLAGAASTLVAAVDPHDVVETRARLAVTIGAHRLADGLGAGLLRQQEPLDPIMVGPQIDEPLYKPLADYNPDRFLPGIGDIPADTITLLETNPRFVEAFMIGANHEMNRELLWRRYPTDRRGTPFHRFWDRVDGAPDIGDIHAIGRGVRLGTSTGADLSGSLVLLVRGQLLRRYPNAVVYAAPALPDGSLDPSPTVVRNPVFWGRLDPDVTFAGFDLTREDVDPDPGWFFVIAEQPVEPRFGLDVPPVGGTGTLSTWSDLNWDHAGVAPGGYLGLGASGLMGESKEIVPGGATAAFGRNSAHLAAITFQRPFRAAIHTNELLEGTGTPEAELVLPVLEHAVLLRPLESGGGG